VTDIDKDALKHCADTYSAKVVDPEDIYDVDMDIYAPCALGATVNDDTLARMNCSIIAGSANNQLADENKHGKEVLDKGIVYAPDFAINAGGVINVYAELTSNSAEWA